MSDTREQSKPPAPSLFARVVGRRYRDPTAEYEELAEEFDANPGAGWVYGVLAAIPVVTYGVSCLILGHGYCLSFDHDDPLFHRYDGPAAAALGWTYLGLGLMLHFHSFWGTRPRLSRYHEPAWFAALCLTLVAATLFAYHVFRLR